MEWNGCCGPWSRLAGLSKRFDLKGARRIPVSFERKRVHIHSLDFPPERAYSER